MPVWEKYLTQEDVKPFEKFDVSKKLNRKLIKGAKPIFEKEIKKERHDEARKKQHSQEGDDV